MALTDDSSQLTQTRPLRFSLRSLLVALAVVSLVLAPFHWFGGAYLFSALCSVGLLGGCIGLYRGERHAGAVMVAIVAAVLGFFLAIGLLVFFLHALLNALLCVLLMLGRVRAPAFAAVLIGVTLSVYGYAFWNGVDGIRELNALKASHPFESLDDRLAFFRSARAENAAITTPPLSPAVATSLDEQEQQNEERFLSRAWALRELHEETYQHFARAAGFGVMRMPSLSAERIVLKERQPVRLPIPLATTSATPLDNELHRMHRTALFDFIDRDRIGYVRSRKAVAGFESHRFATVPVEWSGHDEREKSWQVARLELVSLLRHEEPRVYVAETLPGMDELADVPHRALSTFEAASLPKLQSAEDAVIDQKPDRIQMLGAVRAGKSCLECHEIERGHLLGAFSYEIVPLVK